MSTLNGRVALVTGGSKGIGKAISTALASAGAAVGVNYASDSDTAKLVVAQIENAGGRAVAVQADKSQRPDVERMFAEIGGALGPVDILVNNAAVFSFQPIEDITEAEFYRQCRLLRDDDGQTRATPGEYASLEQIARSTHDNAH